MKLSTINQIVESILAQYKGATVESQANLIANEATIYLKTALICEDRGIDEAMKYFAGDHTTDEYKEFMTEVTEGENYGK